jgi:RNA polymerase sigma-70 factor (ECF subfamily)
VESWSLVRVVRGSRGATAAQREAEFSELFRALYPQAYRVAFRLLGNAAEAEDAAAEAFARTFAAWDRVRGLPYRDAWVMKTTGNVALNVLARKPTPLAPAQPVADEDATATRLALVCALASLSRRQQEAIVLHHLAGLSEAEVAAVLDVAPSTVKTHLKRGMELLRDDFHADGNSDVA